MSPVRQSLCALSIGIQRGDRILKFNGQPIDTAAALRQARLAARGQAEGSTLTIARGEKAMQLKIASGRLGIALQMAYAEPVFQ